MTKNLLNKFNILLLLVSGVFLMACNRQPSQGVTGENLGTIRNEMLVVLDRIDVALESNSMGDFSDKTSEAVSDLDDHIEKYIDEMYNNERKITEESINRLMVIKQKKVEMEFKLALLQKETQPSDTTSTGLSHSDTVITIHNATGSAINQRGRDDEDRVMQSDRRNDDVAMGGMGSDMPASRNPVIERPAPDKTATDLAITDTIVSPRIIEEPISLEGLHQELVKDLRELRKEVELFVQSDL